MRETLKNIWKKAINAVTNFFKGDDNQEQATTPTTTTSWWSNNVITPNTIVNNNTQWTVVTNPTNTDTLNQTILRQQQESKEKEMDEITNTPIWQTNYYDISSVDTDKINKALEEREESKHKSIWDKIWWYLESGSKLISNIVNWQLADSEMQANEEKTYVGYNRDNWNMYELVLDTDWLYWAQEKFNKAYNDLNSKLSQYWNNIPDDVFAQAYDEFYNQVNGLFKTESDDWYSDWLIFSGNWATRIWRRKDSFSEDQLNYLADNGTTTTWKFVPSKEQLYSYLQAQQKNIQNANDVQSRYELNNDPLELDTSVSWRAKETLFNRAMLGVINSAKQNLNPNVANNFLLHSTEIVNGQIDRAWSVVEPLLEEAELVKLEAQREGRELTDEEKKWVELANRANAMLDAWADSLNDFVKEHADSNWVDENWQIIWAKDIFSDWRGLWEVLSKNVIDASWLDTKRWQSLWNEKNVSWLDAFQEVANQWRYNISQSRSWTVWRLWDKLDRVVGKGWTFLSEVWQQTVWALLNIWNEQLSKMVGEDSNWSNVSKFMNQDFTAWMLINTKETWLSASLMWQTWSRTARKYLLKAAEYGPEFLGNVVPDILLYSTWVWEAWAFGTLAKVGNKLKSASAMNKAKNALESIGLLKKANGALEWTKVAAEVVANASDTPNWIRVWLQWLDKGLTNWAIDQLIDAQYSQYDTESYSPESMALSLWGTIGFEIIPWLWKSWALKLWRNALTWNFDNILDWTWWDVLEFFSRPENADAINRIANLRFNKSASWLTFDDLRSLRSSFDEMKDATKQYWDRLQDYQKQWVNKWSKENMYRMLTQVYNLDNNSQVAKNIRAIVTKDWTNIADIAKYLWWIPWTVEVGPWSSTIKLKNANGKTETRVWTYAVWGKQYDESLDIAVDWGLQSKLQDGFTAKDINNISSLPSYKDVNKNMFTEWEDGKYFINEDWLKALWIETKDMPASWAAREINKAEEWEISNKFKEVMKNLRENNRQIKDDTIDLVASSQTYQDIREKVADVVC